VICRQNTKRERHCLIFTANLDHISHKKKEDYNHENQSNQEETLLKQEDYCAFEQWAVRAC
jgi:hypothetical protein